jgi:hypothetical protein
MRELVAEILLRLSKLAAASVVGGVVYVALVGPLGLGGSAELALLSWLAGAAAVILVESSPI